MAIKCKEAAFQLKTYNQREQKKTETLKLQEKNPIARVFSFKTIAKLKRLRAGGNSGNGSGGSFLFGSAGTVNTPCLSSI